MTYMADTDPPTASAVMKTFKGETVFDIGANYGQSCRVFEKNFEQIVAVEPALESYQTLSREAGDKVIPIFGACSSHVGTVSLGVQENHIAQGQLTTMEGDVPDGHAWGKLLERRSVPSTTIDVLTECFGAPSLIKCDVEGHEVEVFLGAPHTITQHRPDLFIEVHNNKLGVTLTSLLEPIYGNALSLLRHDHYSVHDWGYANHYWLIAKKERV